MLQLGGAQRCPAAVGFLALPNQAGLAQHPEVVAQRGGRDLHRCIVRLAKVGDGIDH